jgi:pimeloyl-ACP methyl ester carboxylesterase
MSTRLAGLALVLITSLLSGCGDDDNGGGKTPDAGVTPDAPGADGSTTTDVPRIEPAACRFVVSASLGLTEGSGYSCGDLVVEENRATHAGRIKLHFIRVKSSAATNRATIYLDGGPGGDGQGILDYAAYLGKPFLDGLLVDGDFLVIGQRGTALSIPFLDCQQPDCSDFPGVDLTAYNSAYNADDVNDLRSTLGFEKLNLYGISYGSRLGLEVLRRHGDHVRAAVIEGLVPSSIHWPARIPASFQSALASLNASCAAAGACGTTFGNLATKWATGVDALNTNPVSIQVGNDSIDVDGNTYAYLMFSMMYSKSSYAWLPLMINDLAIRRTDRINNFLAMWLSFEGNGAGISTGLYYGVVCGELYNPTDPAEPDASIANVPAAIVDVFGGSYHGLESVCAGWPKHDLAASMKPAVTSSVRTLVSSGRLDPITPPSFGDIAAATLSNKIVVVHENSGHGATLQSTCGQQNLFAFLANPTAAIDTSCAASISTTYTIPGTFVAPQVTLKQLRAERAVTPRPLHLRRR